MPNNRDYDISNVEVPNSFIQEILSETQPLEESREEVHPSQPQEAQVSEQGEIVKLLSLLFEEFDKLNLRLDKIQERVTEMTTIGMGMATGPSRGNAPSYSCHPERDAQAELEGRRPEDKLKKLLANRTRK